MNTDDFILSLLLSILLTFISYMCIPIVIRLVKGRLPIKKARIICIFNAVIVALLWSIYHFSNGMNINFAPAILWYFVSYATLKEKTPNTQYIAKPVNQEKNIKKNKLKKN